MVKNFDVATYGVAELSESEMMEIIGGGFTKEQAKKLVRDVAEVICDLIDWLWGED